MRLFLAMLFTFFVGPITVAGAGPAAKTPGNAQQPPILELKRFAPKADAFRPGRPPQPLVLGSEKEASEYLAEDELAKLKKEVDFTEQIVLLFAWRGSGRDQLSFVVKESFPEQVTFQFKAGLTRDLREHVHVYAVRANVKWDVASAAKPAKGDKPMGGEVSWDEMKKVVLTGKVDSVSQTHKRRVTAYMSDGTQYEATEPALDDIIKLIRESGKDIPIATE